MSKVGCSDGSATLRASGQTAWVSGRNQSTYPQEVEGINSLLSLFNMSARRSRNIEEYLVIFINLLEARRFCQASTSPPIFHDRRILNMSPEI